MNDFSGAHRASCVPGQVLIVMVNSYRKVLYCRGKSTYGLSLLSWS
jgi:hypothetical protein